jgi:hypothetical protein
MTPAAREVIRMIARFSPFHQAFLAVLVLAPPAPAAEPAPAPRRLCPRFDLTYLPAVGRQGLIGLRPAEIVRDMPELGLQTGRFFDLLGDRLPGTDLRSDDLPALAEIDECVMALQFEIRPTTPGSEHGSVHLGGMTPIVARTVHPFAWDKLITKWFPKGVPTRYAGRSYLRVRLDPLPDEAAFGVFCPDGRTVVVAAEGSVRKLIDRLAEDGPAPKPPPGWGEVDRYPVALAFDNRIHKFVVGKMAKKPGYEEVHSLSESVEFLSLGISAGVCTQFKWRVITGGGRQAKAVADGIRRLLELANPDSGKETVEREMAADALKNLVLDRSGGRVAGSTSVRRNLFRTFAMWAHGAD